MANLELGDVRVGGQAKPQAFSRPRGYWRNTALAYLMILPAALILLTFSIGPVFYAFWMSLHRYGLRLTGPFVGLENYQRILTDGRFWDSLHVTFSYAFFTVPITLALGLFVAYLLFQRIRFLSAYRTVFFLPTSHPSSPPPPSGPPCSTPNPASPTRYWGGSASRPRTGY